MSIEGVDYSMARPDPACLYRAGKRFAGRYTDAGDDPKIMKPDEVSGLTAAGLKLFTIHEEGAGFLLKGYDAGRASAKWSVNQAAACGMPPNRPYYFALDVDPRNFTEAQWRAVRNTLDGAASVVRYQFLGVYGAFSAIEKLVPSPAPWGFQTYAWSDGRISSKAHLYQYRNRQQLCGGTVDFTRALKPDYGQWGRAMQLTQEDLKAVDDICAKYYRMADRGEMPNGTIDNPHYLTSRAYIGQAIRDLGVQLSADNLAELIVARLPKTDITSELVKQAVKDALREGTGATP